MKKFNTLGAIAIALLTAGCSNELSFSEQSGVDETGKERILLSAGDNAEAVAKTRAGFTASTRIVARIVSDSRSSEATQCVKTVLSAKPEADGYSLVEYADGKTRYWDDAYGRNSILSVYAVAIPNNTTLEESVLKGADTWATTNADDNNITWTVATTQTETLLASQDLTYSNNIQETGDKGVWTWDYTNKKYPTPTWDAENKTMNAVKHEYNDGETKYDGRLYFTQEGKGIKDALVEGAGHFDRGHMDFHHALSRVQINIIKGAGFDGIIALDGDMKLNAMPYSGTLDVKAGTWAASPTTGVVNAAKWATAATDKDLTYEAQVLPGYEFTDDASVNAIQFAISKNNYNITNAMLRKALDDAGQTDFTMQQETRYIFNITVSKTEIKVTATVAPWTDVEADTAEPKINIDFAYGHPDSEDECSAFTNKFALYLSETVNADYSIGSNITYEDSKYKFETPLYWPNHETHYFFRGIYPSETTVTDSKITVANGAYNSASAPSNLMIGYPRNTNGTPDEDCKVHSGTQGICATEGNIHLNFQYVMSQVEVNLSTSTGDDKVVLDENTKIEIIGGYSAGTIALADGTATGTTQADYTMNGEITSNAYDRLDAIIPQALSGLKFRITVKDADDKYDTYEATIADIEVTPAGGTKGKITSWQPGKKYIYSLYITKTGIKVTATLKDWETVTSDNNHIWM